MDEMGDEEFLGYMETHSQTERALFTYDHARRLLALAGVTGPALFGNGFISMFYDSIAPHIEEARRLLQKRAKQSQEAALDILHRAVKHTLLNEGSEFSSGLACCDMGPQHPGIHERNCW